MARTPADRRSILSVIRTKTWNSDGTSFHRLDKAGVVPDWFYRAACEINCENRKKLLAMRIKFGTNNGERRIARIDKPQLWSGKILWFIFILSGLFGLRCGATVYHSDGSAASVQAMHNSCVRWRHDHSASGNILLGDDGHYYERHHSDR